MAILSSPSWGQSAPNTADPRKPLIYGICRTPFPALLNLDYAFCRAQAWIEALEMASRHLPATVDLRLARMDLGGNLGRLSVCALLCPLDVVTPENNSQEAVRVFLKWPDSLSNKLERIYSNPQNLLAKMALIWETIQTIQHIRQNWPASLEQAASHMPALEKQTQMLDNLWDAIHEDYLDKKSDSPTITLLTASADTDSGTQNLDNALNEIFTREIKDRQNTALWNRLASQGLYLRALTHEARNQPALAEADFNTALTRLNKSGPTEALAADIHNARGALYEQRNNIEKMCADYMAACALGKCQELSRARRAGHCAVPK